MASVDVRERLRQHFDALPPEKQAGGWNAMWEQNVTPWDRGEPSPALVDTLQYKLPQIEASSFQDTSSNKAHHQPTRRKKALVPGCGRGYDVLLLASYGYDAYGLDTSTLAIQGAQELARSPDRDIQYPPVTSSGTAAGPGTATFLEADFFSNDFLSQTHPPAPQNQNPSASTPEQPSQSSEEEPSKTFDLIYDYTFLCALPPSLRPAWSKRMSQLLSPAGGILICLEFPLKKPPSSGGPPHGLTRELYEQLLNRPGKGVEYTKPHQEGSEGGEEGGQGEGERGRGGGGYVIEDRTTEMPRDALVKVERWKAERTHEVGKGVDFVSVWKHVQ
ncbi:hypothetical protein KC332_g2389 [Hortaea werneckii]|uniref:S-adenosyl-L-methionine-dependent methyltransferase n=2 Tax=Hortaea werneckii TaxID=91943 RepID=A0A3M7I2V6_HORWE|nr:hypothetical protein KC350_g10039 [Hortaea werneckii]OTA35438.1 hypothetical protein BTJ68_03819 [Hortaea werneckii EXF-2000]KAI6826999.1 hypothetical protein KC358_g7649 [Hortaea werneckii]KAI6931029.1 hypothetical protein KC341_g9853 [Hortaea werneckii]KAI6936507.1 hypothetical protein KC348_g6003 [Hortaea werneckii]